jgi:hypothetical protein
MYRETNGVLGLGPMEPLSDSGLPLLSLVTTLGREAFISFLFLVFVFIFIQ